MEWWTHLWLNEGFATFMENFCISTIFPEWEHWNDFATYYIYLFTDVINHLLKV